MSVLSCLLHYRVLDAMISFLIVCLTSLKKTPLGKNYVYAKTVTNHGKSIFEGMFIGNDIANGTSRDRVGNGQDNSRFIDLRMKGARTLFILLFSRIFSDNLIQLWKTTFWFYKHSFFLSSILYLFQRGHSLDMILALREIGRTLTHMGLRSMKKYRTDL